METAKESLGGTRENVHTAIEIEKIQWNGDIDLNNFEVSLCANQATCWLSLTFGENAMDVELVLFLTGRDEEVSWVTNDDLASFRGECTFLG